MDAASREPDLEALMRESAWVRGLARGLLGEGAAADDLAQDVLVAALDRRPGLEGTRLRGWLRTVAQRIALRTRERRGLREHAERASPPRHDGDTDADRDADRRVELQRELSAALGELEPGDRTALVLRYFDGLSTGELARHLGLAEPAARKRVSRALERLRARLDARSGGDRRAWSVALVAALKPRASETLLPTSEALLPAVPTATLLAGLMTKTIWIVAALGAVCLWLALARPWIARPDEASDASGALVPQLADLRSIGADSTHGDTSLAQGERLALDVAGAPEAVRPARVRVVDVKGAAVAGARAAWIEVGGVVSALDLDPDGNSPRPETSRRACFVAVARGHGFGSAPAGLPHDDVVITLPSTRTLTGRVTEDGVAPREPLRLRYRANSTLQGISSLEFSLADVLRALDVQPLVCGVLTGPDGCFSVPGVVVGVGAELQMPTTHQVLCVDGRPQAYMSGRAWLNPDSTVNLIETARLPSVVGRMVWEDTGEPLVGTYHAIFRSNRNVNSTWTAGWLDEQGCFSFGVPIEPHALLEPFETRSAELTERSVRISPSEVDIKSLPFEHEIDLTGTSFPLDVGIVRVPRAPVLHLRLVGSDEAPIRGAAVASDLQRASSDVDGRVCIAAGKGPLRVLALDCALGEFALPEMPTSADAPHELRLAPGATLELITQRGDGPSPLTGQCVRFSWSESPFEGARIVVPGHFEPMPTGLYTRLFGSYGMRDMTWGPDSSFPGRVSVVLPLHGPLLVPGWRLGATARLELLDAVDQPLAALELRVPDEPRRFTADLTGLAPDTGRLRLRIVDAEGQSLTRAWFYVRAQDGTREKYVAIDGSSLDLGPLALGNYDVTVHASRFLEQQLVGLEATPDAPERTVVLSASRQLEIALVDEAGQALRPSAIELRGEAGRWSPSLTMDQVVGWSRTNDLPCTPLELSVVIGTRTWTRAVDAEQTSLSLDLPVHGRLALSVHARELLTGDDGRLAVKLRELGGEGSLAEEVSVDRDGVGPSTATFDLLPGRYALSVDFEEYENPEFALETDEPLRKPLLRREVEVRARERTDVTTDR